jgi:hypothetical protein
MKALLLAALVLNPIAASADNATCPPPEVKAATTAASTCIHDTTLKLEPSRENAETVATAVLGTCADEISTAATLATKCAPNPTELKLRVLDALQTGYRTRIIRTVVEIRAARATKH